jgi:predicted metal-dependent phosphoesterase TrpH
MATNDIVADFHVHTTGSDGTDSLSTRIEQARKRGLDAIAITDHDRVIDELGAGSTGYDDIEVVTGVEVRADLFETKIELLGYFVDPMNSTLTSVLEQARQYRRERNRKLVTQLNEATDIELNYEALAGEVRGGLGRPHIAGVLVEEGYVDSISDAFTEYLAESGDCFVPMERVSYKRVLDAIHAAGGTASLAHPGRIRSDRVPEMVATAADYGLDAIETWYPYGDETAFEVADAHRLAGQYDLLRTGGSDCHGRDSGKFRIATCGMSPDAVERLRDAASTV